MYYFNNREIIINSQVKLIFVNGVRGKPDYQLQEGDRLGVFPAVAGG